MSNKVVVIDTLIKKREQLLDEQRKMDQRFYEEIKEIVLLSERRSKDKLFLF